MKNFKRCRVKPPKATKFGMTRMVATLILGAALIFCFASCKFEVEKEVPTGMTSHEAVAVYHRKQTLVGTGTSLYKYADDGWHYVTAAEYKETKGDMTESTTYAEQEIEYKKVASGTKLADIAKTITGFSATGLVESLQADGTYIVNVYYDRNRVTLTVTGDVSDSLTGLFATAIDFTSVNAKVAQGKFISKSDIPATYPAEDKNCTVTVGTTTIDSTDGFVKIPEGEFKRSTASSSSEANNSNTYLIKLNKDFYMSDHEVTQGEWEKYMTYYGVAVSGTKSGASGSSIPYAPSDKYGKGENYPAYYVNWYEAVIYCNLLSIAKNLTPVYYITVNGDKKTDPAEWLNSETLATNIKKTDDGKYYYDGTYTNSVLNDTTNGLLMDTTANGYRLPTEAEWEYAALGSFKDNSNWDGYGDSSNTSAYVFAGYDGANADDMGKYAWYSSNSSTAHEVKGKLPNSYGLYDMCGSVWEWCYDWYGTYGTSDESDPTGPASGSERVTRGSGWNYTANSCTVSWHSRGNCYLRNNQYGFRVARNAQ